MIGIGKLSVFVVLVSLLFLLLAACGQAPVTPISSSLATFTTTAVTEIRDVEYGRGGDTTLLLDMYIPEVPVATPMPVIVEIHGGGWANGDKYPSRMRFLAEGGFCVVSINYRLSGQAKFPAAVEDCKCAVRWLRAHAEDYNIDPDSIGVWGVSAGGHLAMMVGCADESAGLEGSGGWGEYSSRVQAVCSYFGPTDLTKLLIPSDFIGYTIEERPELYRAASPIYYVTADDPPLLLVHGELDFIVPVSQSEEMYRAYRDAGLEAELVRVEGAGHGFISSGEISPSVAEINRIVFEFFTRYLVD